MPQRLASDNPEFNKDAKARAEVFALSWLYDHGGPQVYQGTSEQIHGLY